MKNMSILPEIFDIIFREPGAFCLFNYTDQQKKIIVKTDLDASLQ